jgi:hypothetical protein
MRLVEGVNSLVHQLYQWPYSRKRDRADGFSYFEEAWEEYFPVAVENEATVEPNINAWRQQYDEEQMLLEDMAG